MHHVNEGGIAGLHLADQEHRPGALGDKVQLLGADIDVPSRMLSEMMFLTKVALSCFSS